MGEKSNWFLNVPSRTATAVMIVVGIAVGLIVVWISYCFGKNDLATTISLFISFGSFVVLIFTVYYAYRLVLVSWVPVGSFGMRNHPEERHLIITFPKNHTTLQNIEMWAKLNPKVNGQPVEMTGFYGGEHSWFIQPLAEPRGVFDIQDVLAKAGESISSMKQAIMKNPEIRKTQLRFKVKIWFRGVESNIERNYPEVDEYYYNFIDDVLVLDV